MLKEEFKEKMKEIIHDGYDDFIEALECGAAVRGLRQNLIKTNGTPSEGLAPYLTKLSYVDNGYILSSDIQIGRTAEHHAGLIYMQDPGAMATAAALDIEPDWWVADLCAAPGGKSSQIAEKLNTGSFLLSNEYVPKRAKIIVGNFERLGVTRAVVTSLDTARLRDMYIAIFDLVIVDAPCSGEGMFRKSDEAREGWSVENVLMCSKRQREILENARGMVKPGGYLLYSTCTFSPEENEDVIIDFLSKSPEFSLVKVKDELIEVTSPGIERPGSEGLNIEYTRRFYPHIFPGEGQYVALMKKDENTNEKPTTLYKDAVRSLTKDERAIIDAFEKESLTELPNGRVARVGESIVFIPHSLPVPEYGVFMSGVLFGEIKGRTFAPAHHFFSAYGGFFKTKVELSRDDERLEKYLLGEEIDVDPALHGWCVVTFEGAPLGGGKASGGRLKNHYPKGLRNLK